MPTTEPKPTLKRRRCGGLVGINKDMLLSSVNCNLVALNPASTKSVKMDSYRVCLQLRQKGKQRQCGVRSYTTTFQKVNLSNPEFNSSAILTASSTSAGTITSYNCGELASNGLDSRNSVKHHKCPLAGRNSRKHWKICAIRLSETSPNPV